MEKNLIKNVDFATPLVMEGLVDYEEGRVVSRTLAQGRPLSVTLFAFDKGEEISSHSASGMPWYISLMVKQRLLLEERNLH